MIISRKVKVWLKCLLKTFYINFYNKKHETKILSSFASTNASYGRNVAIGNNTWIGYTK